MNLVELLIVHYGADLNCQDEDGETALHLTLHKLNQQPSLPAQSSADSTPGSDEAVAGSSSDRTPHNPEAVVDDKTPVINNIMQNLPPNSSAWLGVACLLVQRGASVTVFNSRGVSPLQSVSDLAVLQALQSHAALDNAVVSNATRMDLDMKALDLAAEGLRTVVLEEGGQSGPQDTIPSSSALTAPNFPPCSSSSSGLSSSHRSTSQPASPAKFPRGCASSASQPASPAHQAAASTSPDSLCIICMEGTVCVRFEPCGHSITCEECCARVKKCLTCQALVVQKVRHDGRVLNTNKPSTDRLKYLESKIADIEEAHSCSICMERCRSVAFMCGHSACFVCAKTLSTCHMCRKPITVKINLY